jgi:malate dehydrogenase
MFNKITIVGAGNVGSTLAFLIVANKLCKKIMLIDVEGDLAKATALDLEDSRFSFGANLSLEASSNLGDVASSDLVVITAGRPRSPGMSREDLVKINSSIVQKVCSQIKAKAKDAIVIVITNPLDIMTYIALTTTGFSRKRVIGMGSSLDSARFANLLSKKLRVAIENINPFVFGAHGKNMLVSSTSTIRGLGLEKFIKDREAARLKSQTIARGARIVSLLKKGSARFGPAASCLEIIEAIGLDKKKLTFAASYLNGEYGLKGVCVGVPVIIGARGIERIIEITLSKREKKVLTDAAKILRKNINSL